ncbi:MAG: bactofilin family protein [Silvanigrellaceae bacterium]
MVLKKTDAAYNDREIRAFLEEGCEFEGKLNFNGVVRLNGRFFGDIDSDDTLIIGETALVQGNIRVGVAILGGRVVGDVSTKHYTEILSTGIVEGSITSPKMITHEGAQIIGHITVQHEKPELTLVSNTNTSVNQPNL